MRKKILVMAAAVAAALALSACAGPSVPPPAYSLLYESSGASGQAPVDTFRYSAGSLVLAADSGDLVKADQYLAGWAVSPSGELAYAPGAAFSMPAADTTLYAVWRPVVEATGFGVLFTFADDADLELAGPFVVTKPAVLGAAVADAYASYQWYLDGSELVGQSGPTSSIATAGLAAGNHTLMVVVVDAAGSMRSGSAAVRVEN